MCRMFPLACQADDHVFTWLLVCPHAALAYEQAQWADLLSELEADIARLFSRGI